MTTTTPHQFSKSALRRMAIITPLVKPETCPRLHRQFRRKRVDLARVIAHEAGIGLRTLYRWLWIYKRHGFEALAINPRADCGMPRALNQAAVDLLLKFALPTGNREPSVAEIFRAYNSEREFRRANENVVLTDEFSKAKYRALVHRDGRLRADAQLPEVSYETIRHWINHIPDLSVQNFASYKGGKK